MGKQDRSTQTKSHYIQQHAPGSVMPSSGLLARLRPLPLAAAAELFATTPPPRVLAPPRLLSDPSPSPNPLPAPPALLPPATSSMSESARPDSREPEGSLVSSVVPPPARGPNG